LNILFQRLSVINEMGFKEGFTMALESLSNYLASKKLK